jgi:hypothetical protein
MLAERRIFNVKRGGTFSKQQVARASQNLSMSERKCIFGHSVTWA